MFKKLFTKKNNKVEKMVMVTYKHESEETNEACTEIMSESALAGMVVNDLYVEIIKVIEL